jgi:tryptophan-rich sensory protein
MQMMRGLTGLAVFVILVIGTGFAIGFLNVPGGWYAGLNKPWFNPANWIFAPVWTVIYLLIAIAGWRTWNLDPRAPAMRLWFAQMALNFLWSPTFFSLHWTGVALAIILSLFAAILAFIAWQWERDRISSLLFVPYAAWIGFASILNLAIVNLN